MWDRPTSAHRSDAASLSDLVIISQARAASVRVRYRCCSWASRSSALRMVTFTMLAESKWAVLCSQHCSPWPGSSTPTATAETRPRRARSISRSSRAASAGWDEDLQLTAETAALAGEARNGTGVHPSRTAVTAMISPRPRFIAILPGQSVGQ